MIDEIKLNRLPASEASVVTPEPAEAPDEAAEIQGDSLDEYLSEMTEMRGFSADTVINEETNLPEVVATEAATDSRPPLTEKEAWDNTETLINLRETVQSYGLSYYVDGNFKNAAQYDYEADEKQRLIRAWSRVIGHYNVRVSPWVDVIITEAVCTGPLVALAYNNRSQRIELEKQRAEIQRLRRENEKLQNAASNDRRDTKTHWKIDDNGYFEYTIANTYLPKGKRSEKPKLTPENYELLVKHNGKDFVNNAFGLKNE